ncbi:hypothetical protein MPTK1_3g12690 [Marchantia polymorpha subsp. ruderalis]|uniref:SUN domain-containing protein n=2 Tax=Marchantia polymorpha TaxID=3197 RepID=A0AAF6B056_MARPO|nr:hypothetical protein MARPO_0050s0062 [Marchantia polymorpha]BBN05390.1 hypothetical protein Mp_3g12690 [Marchantia polymorpha subsp. ruderalis]|eukprot:PTQ38605.1 hypothetical protein MARPO_0050s0062 [Marchantia polymorpha]
MKEIEVGNHMRRVTRRVSTVSRGRCIHGLPCSLPFPSWTLILLLLLSSTFSHVHEAGEKVSEEAAFGAHENSQVWNEDNENSISGRALGNLVESSSVAQHEESLKDNELEASPLLTSFPAATHGKTRDVVDEVDNVHVFLPTSGSPLDALQYSEYGAGLLHRSGATEESSNVFLTGNPGGVNCPILDAPVQSTGAKCVMPYENLPCTVEFLAQEHCQLFEAYNGESFGELNPGEYYLLCRRSTATGLDLWEIACSSLTQCFKRRLDSKTCHFERSLGNSFFQFLGRYKLPAQEPLGVTEISINGEANDRADTESEQAEASNTLAPPASPSSEAQLVGGNLQEGDLVTAHDGTAMMSSSDEFRADESRITGATHEVKIPSDLGVHHDLETDTARESLLSSINMFMDSFSDASKFDGTRVSSNPRLDLGGNRDTSEDILAEELEMMMNLDDEWLSSVKPPRPGDVEIENQLEPVKLRRVGSVMSLDEYKRSILEKQKLGNDVDFSSVHTHKMRHSDESYNYAANSHGAKVLSSNKEAKGAGHIINSDKDKYLRNPCSADEKYVVLELSEETFVDTVVVANFEFHSANLKDFEVYGSPTYPTKEWILLGRYQAENVRHRQKFTIEDPKLVRYLMLKMLSHWGSEFFCTLSIVEVFGVDVIKNLLDDWIASEEGESGARTHTTVPPVHHEETSEVQYGSSATFDAAVTDVVSSQALTEAATSSDSAVMKKEKKVDGASRDEDSRAGDSAPEVHYLPGGKPPGDSVLKILMQKVKALELNQSLFDNYLEDMNVKYKAMLSELDKDLAVLSERLRNETATSALLAMRLADMEIKRKGEKTFMEYQFAMVASNFTENIEFMRWQIQSMERREITAVILALFSMIISALLHLMAQCMPNRRLLSTHEYPLHSEGEAHETNSLTDSCTLQSVCKLSSSVILYLSCGLTILVLSV